MCTHDPLQMLSPCSETAVHRLSAFECLWVRCRPLFELYSGFVTYFRYTPCAGCRTGRASLNVRKWAEVIVPCIDPDLARFAMAEKTGESIHCFRFLRGETASHPALMFYRYSHMDGPHFAWRPKPVQEGQLLDDGFCVSKVQCTGFKCWEITATKEGMEKKLPPMTSSGIHVLRGGYPDLLQLEEHDVTEGWLESGGAYGKLRSLIKKVGSRAVLPLL